jgi:hypothetical protein
VKISGPATDRNLSQRLSGFPRHRSRCHWQIPARLRPLQLGRS